MRLLIDECLPRALKRLLTGYTSRAAKIGLRQTEQKSGCATVLGPYIFA
jgi:hypothetical protein